MDKLTATVLLVEDDATFREGLSDLLAVAGKRYKLNVFTAPDGVVALRLMEGRTPDLIISDIVMPNMGGHEFLARIRREPEWIHIPFIILTGRYERREMLEGRSLGAELYLTKPYHANEFVELVESQLDRMFLLRAAREENLLALKRNILQLLNHEFRTPLTYVTAYYEMLAESLGNLEESQGLQAYLHGIRAGSLRLIQLVHDLVLIMELRTGDAARRFAEEAAVIPDAGAIFQEAAMMRQDDALVKNITMQWHVESDLPTIFGHAASLQDALDRLIDNAIKFTPLALREPGSIRLEIREDEGWLSVTVHDRGIGFPGYAVSQLFEPFYQHNRRLLEQQGSGSGLAIVKGIVDLHGGRVEAQSEEGLGSRFRMLLPPHQIGADPRDRDSGLMPRSASVLVVEDDQFLLEGLRELLELFEGKYKLEVLTATNGKAGLCILESNQPDLIISDVMMPELDGYTFLAEVRKRTAWLHIPVIFLTARSGKQERHRGLLSGVEEYIAKPYDIDELLQLVVTQLDRHFQQQSAVHQSFEEIKRSILNLLRPSFMTSLEAVDEHSQKLENQLAYVNTDQELKSSLVSIQDASTILAQLVENFIALAEFKTGEAELSFASRARLVPGEELRAILIAHTIELREQAVKFGVALEHAIAPDLPSIFCDTHAIRQCVIRLFEIVLKLRGNSHANQLTFAIETEADTLIVDIQLSGAPFGAEIAEMFTQLNQVANYENLDLPDSEVGPSLMVVKGLLALHAGQLAVHVENRIARMTMRLPVVRALPAEFPTSNSLRA